MDELLVRLRSEWLAAQYGVLERVPLYYQIYSILKSSILDGSIPYANQMPTENEIVNAFDVSRITAKRAMDELAADKLIVRTRGKGSHVVHRFIAKPVRAPLIGTLEALIDMSEHSIVRVVSVEQDVPPVDIGKRLALSESELAHKVIRVSSNEDSEPYAYYVSWTIGIESGYSKQHLEAQPRLELLRGNGIVLTEMHQKLSAINAPLDIARELDIDQGAALLAVRRLGCISDGTVVDILDGFYDPQRYQYAMVMSVD